MSDSMAAVRGLAVGFACVALVITGCEEISISVHDRNVTTAESPTNTSTSTPVNTSGTYFVAGNSAVDGGSEVWKQFPGFDVRLSVNDTAKIPGCVNDWYSIDGGIVQSAGGLTYQENSDGTYTFTATDFVSGQSGLHYKHFGFTIQYSSADLVETNVLVLQKSDQQNTLRILWATVAP